MCQARTRVEFRRQVVKGEEEEFGWGHLTLPLPLNFNGQVAFLFFLPLVLGVGFFITANYLRFPDHPCYISASQWSVPGLLNSLVYLPLSSTMRGHTLQLFVWQGSPLAHNSTGGALATQSTILTYPWGKGDAGKAKMLW